MHCSRLILSILSFLLLACGSGLRGDDWPEILGPNRAGRSAEMLPDSFPAAGPKLAWTATIGQGYAGPAVVGEQVILFHRQNELERVESFHAATGKQLWKTDYPATYRGGIDRDHGPRCVPTLLKSENKIVVYGAAGVLHCLTLDRGEKLWSRKLAIDFDAPDGYFGAGSTPVVVNGMVVVNVGGSKGGIVGLALESGETKWATTKESASYSSPIALDRDGISGALLITRMHLMFVDAENGAAKTLLPFGRSGPTVNAAIPLVLGKRVFATSSYDVGAILAELSDGTAIWENDTALSSQYSTPVVSGNHLYGIHGREDIPPAHLRCLDPATGKVAWSRDDFGVAHLIAAKNHLLLLTVDGELVLVAASPDKYRELGRAQIAKGTTRAIPALANGRFYCRSGEKLLCLELNSQ